MIVLVNNYNWTTFWISLPWQILTIMTFSVFFCHSWLSMSCIIYLGCVCISTMAHTNKKIMNIFHPNIIAFQRNLNIHIHKCVKQFILEHNHFCHELYEMNRFWSKLYFIFTFNLIPTNLILLHQLLFENLETLARLVIGVSSLLWIIEIFLIPFVLAHLTKQIHKTTKMLAQLQWRLNGWPFRLRNKIKLMAYFERLSHKKKIGISIGQLVVITYAVFYLVIIFFL